MKPSFLSALIALSFLTSGMIQACQQPKNINTNDQSQQALPRSPRIVPFLESLSSPNDFLKPLPTAQRVWKDFDGSDYTTPAIMDLVLSKRAAPLMLSILQKNPDLRVIMNEHKQNVFHRLASYGPAQNMRKIIAYCLSQHYNIQELVNARDDRNRTPLHLAAQSCKTHCLQLLLLYGSNRDAQDDDGNTPLHLAAITHARGKTKRNHTVTILCQAGASKTILNHKLETSLSSSFICGLPETGMIIFNSGPRK